MSNNPFTESKTDGKAKQEIKPLKIWHKLISASAILGFVIALAVRQIGEQRQISFALECAGNLRYIANAKKLWAKEHPNVRYGYSITLSDLRGVTGTIKCPMGGRYVPNAIADEPTCSELSNRVAPHRITYSAKH
jgi:hypothetical protein